ncbi:MAG: metallophosphoesterase [Firmicutes bacterium]|nr:metallophosphoesterase [Bacillota bacterium]
MSLYTIGDLHLHFLAPLKAQNQLKDRVWKNHEKKFEKYCRALIREDDTLLLAGDHSWGRTLQEAMPDLKYISELPGRKILLRGNHDMFWDAAKTDQLNERFSASPGSTEADSPGTAAWQDADLASPLYFLQNNYYPYEDYALVGTKGFTFEGPFYLNRSGRIIGWDEEKETHARKLIERELGRLRISFEKARADGYRKFIMFLHYPPTDILEEESVFTRMAEEFGAEQVIYAHSHGESRFHDSILGEMNGVRYQLVSGDFLKWHPYQVL